MAILGFQDLQRQSLQIGELRIGTSVAVPGKSHRRPVRLDTYRITAGSRATAEGAAEIYGGTVAPWEGHKGMWEVITERTELRVWVPPRGDAVSAWMEAWDGPRCLAKCDGITMIRPKRGPCMCPHPEDPGDAACVAEARAERMRLAALRPPKACHPMARYKVSITELPGALGVFKLVTGSEAAAVESADSGELLAVARERGIYLPAIAGISWRTRIEDGKPYPVPTLQIGASLAQIARGELPAGPAGLMAAIAGASSPAAISGPERVALTAGTGQPTEPPAVTELEDVPPPDEPADDQAPDPLDDPALQGWERATIIADRARAATTAPQLRACFTDARTKGLYDDPVCVDPVADHWQPLRDVLDDLWKAAAEAAKAGAPS